MQMCQPTEGANCNKQRAHDNIRFTFLLEIESQLSMSVAFNMLNIRSYVAWAVRRLQ
jgi:hypothetical protein